ncbi:putative ribonuclease H-like domain-containing protein [Tanacetum coccineum]
MSNNLKEHRKNPKRNKKDENGIVIRNKAILVAQGYIQEAWIDYDEVFAAVERIEAIRLFLAYASFKEFVVYQMDVKSAFLHGKIKEEVYICQPLGFEDLDFPDKVYKVEKALYGLHQAPRAWYETLSTYLLDNGFQRGKIDKTLFIKRHKGDILLVQVYVDDIIFGSTKKELCNAFEKLMHEKFQMSSMGELTFFLGLQVKQKKDGIFISQDKYVAEILKKFGFTEVKTASTLMETQKPLLKDGDGEELDVHMYRSMIGSLMYLTSSRPDIMFVVCACARYQVNPKVSHLYVVKRIFRMQAQEQEELTIEENATLFQQLLKKIRKHFVVKRVEEKKNPPTKAQERKIMCTYLKNMEGYKLKYLKLKEFDSIQELFDRAFKRVNIFEDFRIDLVEGKEKRAGTKLIQENTKKQKVEDDKETAELKQLMKIIPDKEEVAIDAIPLAIKSSNEYLHPYEPSQSYQTNNNDVSFIEPYEFPEPFVLESEVSSDQNGKTDQNDRNDQNDQFVQNDEILNTSAHNTIPILNSSLSIPSMVTPAPQNRWSLDKHIELVNIIGNPGAGMLTRDMAKELGALQALPPTPKD